MIYPCDLLFRAYTDVASLNNAGPSDLQIISLKASSLGADSIYGLADQMTITFSEATNMGGSYQGQVLSPTEVRQMFNFSQALGSAYSGAWTSPSTFQISIEDNLGALPPEIGHLVVIVLAAANIRNNPPQSSVTVGITSPVLDGNFGPSTMEIVAFTAHDPENSANVVSLVILVPAFDYLCFDPCALHSRYFPSPLGSTMQV